MEIGSYFLQEENYSKKLHTLIPYLQPFGEHVVYVDSGRSALRLIAQSIKKKKVLLPDYLCDSMIQPFRENDYVIDFYHIDRSLNPVLDSIHYDNTYGVFVHLGYFGGTTAIPNEVIHQMKNIGITVVEDITHTLFSKRKQTSSSDFAICSIRKWIGIPDGGILISKMPFKVALDGENEAVTKAYFQGSQIKKENMINAKNTQNHLNWFRNVEENFDSSSQSFEMSRLSQKVLKEYDFDRMSFIRKRNAHYLVSKLGQMGFKSLSFNSNIECVPLFVPIIFNSDEERNKVRDYLVRHKIYTPVHWQKPMHPILQNHLYDVELSIPCDQRYTIDDMERIINAIEMVIKEF